ncbi:MAG: purine-nucleoside phosphorylase [Tunicatimonas sp.]
MTDQLQETQRYLADKITTPPTIGIVLGTGLGGLAREIQAEHTISYADLPHFPVSTVETHSGKLIYGTLGNQRVIAMQGRFHHYEGYTMQQITYPIRLMKLLGVTTLYISNVAGGINTRYEKGDLVIIEDHINLQTANPLTGPNLDEFGPRFPDMSQPYDAEMMHHAWQVAKEAGFRIHKGVYAAVNGPNLETRAEYRFLRTIGADLVGMSTVPEVIVANHMGLRVLAVSIVTDLCDPDQLEPVDVSDIIRVAGEAEPKLTRLFYNMINP